MPQHSTALIVGANRGIGLGVVREYLSRGVSVIATARNPDAAAELRALAQANPGRVDIRALDMNDGAQIDAFAATLQRAHQKKFVDCAVLRLPQQQLHILNNVRHVGLGRH